MSKEQSQRMSNEYDAKSGIMTWVRNRDRVMIASLDLNKVWGAYNIAVRTLIDTHVGVVADVLLLGFSQKVGHGAAVPAYDGNKRRSDAELWELKRVGMERIITALYAGETRVAATRDSILRQALERIAASSESSEKARAVCTHWLNEWIGMEKDEKARIAALGPVRKAILEIEAERLGAAGLDDDEFNGL